MARVRFKDEPMQEVIDASGPSAGWLRVIEKLLALSGHEAYYLTVRMTAPFERDLVIDGAFARFARHRGVPSIDGIAATIFPRSFYRFNCEGDRHVLYMRYPEFRARAPRFLGKRPTFSYFSRLVAWEPVGVDAPVNQLEAFITRMREHKAKREAWYFYPIIDPTRDLNKIMSGPCLTAIDLKYEIEHNTLNLFAFYRDHEFAEKALGNYVGLSHLLEFLCDQTKTAAGAITCVSLRARIEQGYAGDLDKVLAEVQRGARGKRRS
ncbi:MAG: hypothetical protein HYS14_11720 [Candidatus Rokubacteria bacterium]|nr:hypothetical protein [Candidatus Rokubacteria bacterium]